MMRGYDVIFQNKLLGMISIGALVCMFIVLLIWGGIYAGKLMASDSAARKRYREEHPSEPSNLS